MLLAVALVATVMCAGPVRPAHAAWGPPTARAASVASAQLSSAFQLLSGGGAVSTDGKLYQIASLLVGGNSYVDLVNTSTMPAKLALKLSLTTVLGSSPATVCSVAWNTTTGACPGTSTVVGITVTIGTTTGAYTTPAALPVGGHVYLKIVSGGVASGVTFTADTVTAARTATDRSAA
ncbi:hypothetical protein ACQP00_28680 [Dactylosporangium sp. CS-047395]|uniref:hypothetical protein n=1 Tax=Dactylosporangium sp. CS-047395 TaxID=3239936 RepID=UPI003D8A6438